MKKGDREVFKGYGNASKDNEEALHGDEGVGKGDWEALVGDGRC